MKKLDELIANAAKLAAAQPAHGETLDWNGQALAGTVAEWQQAQLCKPGPRLLIDVPAAALEGCPEPAASAPAWLVQSTAAAAQGLVLPEGWQVSQRLPSDLFTLEEALLAWLPNAGSMLAIQEALLQRQDREAWIQTGALRQVMAPFLLNTTSGNQLPLVLAECARVLETGGSFETLVLAPDEPLSGSQIVCEGHLCRHFPKEDVLADVLLRAGFHGVTLTPLLDRPAVITEGAELRAFALSAYTGTKGVCLEQGDAAVYLGPWSQVADDDGHVYPRGVRIAVCAKTAAVLQRPPYAGSFAIIPAYGRPPLEEAALFDCSQTAVRPVAETKGRAPLGSSGRLAADCSGGDCGC
ncbi:hypothetical protein [Cribrihabitans neustonicus]|uniref:hypothetical protein n=1 Tax=Cribrihabitans neustonicus TaxID=1429085 RepID=UPI003B5CCB25